MHQLRRLWDPARVSTDPFTRLEPVSRRFGMDRGLPLDRYYIERFLAAHAADVHGRVLEIGDPGYTRRFGGDRVTRSDVLGARPGMPAVTIVGDLTRPDGLPLGCYDCVILTQTLPFIYDVGAAVRTVHLMLRPGGVLLATAPVISHISRYDMDRWGDFWRLTDLALRRLLETVFPPAAVTVAAHGNVRVAAAFLYGLVVEDLPPEALAVDDPDYPLVVTARAVTSQACDR
ncbi:MAG: methyltransferase [Deltaproteobacteria bacterium]|nr:methyltransferase [Deltaproteobacteria bacterium]